MDFLPTFTTPLGSKSASPHGLGGLPVASPARLPLLAPVRCGAVRGHSVSVSAVVVGAADTEGRRPEVADASGPGGGSNLADPQCGHRRDRSAASWRVVMIG